MIKDLLKENSELLYKVGIKKYINYKRGHDVWKNLIRNIKIKLILRQIYFLYLLILVF